MGAGELQAVRVSHSALSESDERSAMGTHQAAVLLPKPCMPHVSGFSILILGG